MGMASIGDEPQHRVSGFPDVALPLPPPTDAKHERIPATAGPRDAAPDDLVPPDPVHHRVRG